MATLKEENSTIEYYNQNSDTFINATFDADMNSLLHWMWQWER